MPDPFPQSPTSSVDPGDPGASAVLLRAGETGGGGGTRRPTTDALQKAIVCLERSGRRLRAGRAEQTDDVLELLRTATAYLLEATGR